MKKSFKIILGLLITISFIAITCIVLNNIISNHNIAFPKVLTISSDNKDYYARKKYVLWQKPDETDGISGIVSPPMITDNRVETIKEFLKEDEFIQTNNNNLIVNLDNLKDCNMEDIKDISIILYNDEKAVSVETEKIVDNTITISLNELTTNTNYYGEIRITYPYSSIVEYVFKFVIK